MPDEVPFESCNASNKLPFSHHSNRRQMVGGLTHIPKKLTTLGCPAQQNSDDPEHWTPTLASQNSSYFSFISKGMLHCGDILFGKSFKGKDFNSNRFSNEGALQTLRKRFDSVL